jgi:hypothetical protein
MDAGGRQGTHVEHDSARPDVGDFSVVPPVAVHEHLPACIGGPETWSLEGRKQVWGPGLRAWVKREKEKESEESEEV